MGKQEISKSQKSEAILALEDLYDRITKMKRLALHWEWIEEDLVEGNMLDRDSVLKMVENKIKELEDQG